MDTCPHCGATPCIGVLRKLALGPASRTLCRTCGLRVRVETERALIALVPPVLVVIAISVGVLRDFVTAGLLVVVTMTATVVLYLVWVPLLPGQISNASIVAAAKARVAAERRRP